MDIFAGLLTTQPWTADIDKPHPIDPTQANSQQSAEQKKVEKTIHAPNPTSQPVPCPMQRSEVQYL